MSSHTDAFQDALQKRRRLGVLVAIGIVLAAGGGVLAVMFWPPPAAPAEAQVALSTVEGEGFSLGCPEAGAATAASSSPATRRTSRRPCASWWRSPSAAP